MLKTCNICHKELPLESFNASKSNKGGTTTWCKSCVREYGQAYRSKNKEKLKGKSLEYRLTHKEQKAEADKKYRDEHIEEVKAYKKIYRETNSDYFKQYRQAYYIAHKEEQLAKEKNNRPHINALRKKRIENNINFKLAERVRSAIAQSVRKVDKCKRSIHLLGCDIIELRQLKTEGEIAVNRDAVQVETQANAQMAQP